MANYICTERTNYFKIDPAKKDAFGKWVEGIAEVHPREDGSVCLLPDGEGFPDYVEDGEGGERQVDLMGELADFLAPDSVAVRVHVGAEKYRYVQAFAEAIDATGKHVSWSLDKALDDMAASFPGKTITEPAY